MFTIHSESESDDEGDDEDEEESHSMELKDEENKPGRRDYLVWPYVPCL